MRNSVERDVSLTKDTLWSCKVKYVDPYYLCKYIPQYVKVHERPA